MTKKKDQNLDPVADRAYLRKLSRNSTIAIFFTLLGIAIGYALLT